MDQELNTSAPQEQFNQEQELDKVPTQEVENSATPIVNPVEATPAEESPAEETPAEEAPAEEVPAEADSVAPMDFSTLSVAELLTQFEAMIEAEDKTELHKNAETIKSCFYKQLHKDQPEEETLEDKPETTEEITFKRLYARYKVLRADLLRTLELQKEKNLEEKLAIIEGIKVLLEEQEDINHTFPKFRALQLHWKEVGPVPLARTKDVWETYQHCVEKFYDYVKINNELRDLDFKRNLELKEQLCVKAEALVDEPSVIAAFHKLQKLHEEWREIGPIARELREPIWERFKASTTAVNKRHQDYFEEQKQKQKENFEAKVALCEKAEAIAQEKVEGTNGWNKGAKALEELQKEWRTIGFASKKENQKVYDRFRAACDSFYNAKREFYASFKDEMQDNLNKKLALCEQAEALNQSEDWRKTTDQLINIQKQWKEIGPVPRKQADVIWKRFRTACDEFFTRKSKHFSNVDSSYDDNLKAKEALLKEMDEYDIVSAEETTEALRQFQARWNAIGFVPLKEKERIQRAYKDVLDKLYGSVRSQGGNARRSFHNNNNRKTDDARSGRDKLVLRFRQLESDITVWENNMGFFAKSKNADKILADTRQKIEEAKAELAELEAKIKAYE